jgi:hypothetical protein
LKPYVFTQVNKHKITYLTKQWALLMMIGMHKIEMFGTFQARQKRILAHRTAEALKGQGTGLIEKVVNVERVLLRIVNQVGKSTHLKTIQN